MNQLSVDDQVRQSGQCSPMAGHEQGVGARHGPGATALSGGGYLDICNDFGAALPASPSADPRLDELRRIGLPRVWLAVAIQVGFDAFMSLWLVLMREGHVDDRNRVVVPNYSRYLRFQRNQLIRELDEEGHTADQIRREVKRLTGQDLDITHVRRTMRPRSTIPEASAGA